MSIVFTESDLVAMLRVHPEESDSVTTLVRRRGIGFQAQRPGQDIAQAKDPRDLPRLACERMAG